jgi:flagellin-specific chaperone FliS
MENSVNGVESLIEVAPDDAKKMYMQRIWAMDKEQIFHELMRVHGESSKLLSKAQTEINRLRELLNFEDGDAIH